MTTDNLSWIAARASGMLGYVLVTVSVAFGVALSLKVRSRTWPRYVTTEVHRRITLLALAFTALHGITLWLDPFQAFSPIEVIVPGASHYRPLWVALGIIAGDLLLALWLSERLQRVIGYAWWRRLHYLTFVAWILVTIHGLGTGTDSRAPWAIGLYAGGTLLVAGLILMRVWPVDTARRTAVMAFTTMGVWILAVWAFAGPLRTGWNDLANNGNGSGQAVAAVSTSTGRGASSGLGAGDGTVGQALPSPTLAPASGGPLPVAFQATFTGQLQQVAQSDGSSQVTIQGSLTGGLTGQLVIQATQSSDGTLLDSQVVLTANGGSCTGSLLEAERGRISTSCVTAAGQSIPLRLQLSSQPDGTVLGNVTAGRIAR